MMTLENLDIELLDTPAGKFISDYFEENFKYSITMLKQNDQYKEILISFTKQFLDNKDKYIMNGYTSLGALEIAQKDIINDINIKMQALNF